MKLEIAFTMRNLLDISKAAIGSIRTRHKHYVFAVSDWSTDGTNEWLQDLAANTSNVYVELEPMTDSLAGKWNIAARAAWALGCDAVLLCNNDIIFHPATIDALVDRMAEGDVGMVTAHNVRSYVSPEELSQVLVPENPTESESPDFSCFLLDKDTWDKVGPFDEAFVPCYFEDNDYHYRMMQAGIKAITTTAAPYYHYGSKTQQSVPGGVCKGEQFMRNRQHFMSKHGVDPATYKPVWD